MILRLQIICLIAFAAISTSAAQGFLKTEGQKIVNENGEEVILRGIGLGGWMLQEGYMLGTSGPQHELEARFKLLVGEEKTKQFYDAWLNNHMRKIDVDSMAAWGFNSIRLPMHYKLFTPPIEEEPVAGQITWREKGFQMTDSLLEWVKANDMYLILDLHAAPGGQGENADISDYDRSKPSLWESEANKAKTIALWRKLAERYADEPNIGGYDLINEPNWGFENHAADPNGCAEKGNAPLWTLLKDITETIREVDKKHIIVIEGNCWGNNYNGMPTLWDDNLVISYHKYWNPNSLAAIQGMLDMRSTRNVPIWLGESGENSNSWFTEAITLLETNHIGWCWWPFKKLGYNNPLQVKTNSGYRQILDYWAGKAPKPTMEQAFDALMQYAEDLKLENNIYHPDVVDAMIRQPHSDEALPFRKHVVSAESVARVFAVDFDLGRNEIAYSDAEVLNSTGNAGGQEWNKGRSYRNDGVDIQASVDEVSNGYSVGWTVDGEWLQYTLEVEEEGYYTVRMRIASETSGGKAILTSGGVKLSKVIDLPKTGSYQVWTTVEVHDAHLEKGQNRFRVQIEKGGFNLNYIEFEKQDGPLSEQPEILEGSIRNLDQVISIALNQELEEIPAGHGFSVTVNGADAAIISAVLKEDIKRVLLIELDEPVSYGDIVMISYAGSSIKTLAGAFLEPFSNVIIDVVSETAIVHIPGKIEVEDNTANHGFEFEACTDAGGGQNAGYTDAGDYLDFILFVEQEGYYRLSFRVASESANGSLILQDAGNAQSPVELSRISFTPSGGWQKWKTVSAAERVHFGKGLHHIRMLSASSLFNINWLELTDPVAEVITGIDADSGQPSFLIFPNPSSGKFTVRVNSTGAGMLTIHDCSGKVVSRKQLNSLETEIQDELPSGLYIVSFRNRQSRHYGKVMIR